MHEHGCLHFHIQNKNLYKTEQKKLIVQFEKKNLTIICQKQNSRTNIARSNEILGWEGVGNRQCCAFLKRRLIGAC
jgi:hypothetical protein